MLHQLHGYLVSVLAHQCGLDRPHGEVEELLPGLVKDRRLHSGLLRSDEGLILGVLGRYQRIPRLPDGPLELRIALGRPGFRTFLIHHANFTCQTVQSCVIRAT